MIASDDYKYLWFLQRKPQENAENKDWFLKTAIDAGYKQDELNKKIIYTKQQWPIEYF